MSDPIGATWDVGHNRHAVAELHFCNLAVGAVGLFGGGGVDLGLQNMCT